MAKNRTASTKGKAAAVQGKGSKAVKAVKPAPASARKSAPKKEVRKDAPPKAKAAKAPAAKVPAVKAPKAVVTKGPVAAPKPAAAKVPPPKPAAAKGAAPKQAATKATSSKAAGKAASSAAPPQPPRPMPRATKLPPMGEPFTQREMEQLLTAGLGRGIVGEGPLKGRLVVKDNLPHLIVLGRDKRELDFLLEGPDQEVLPAYVDHKVSVIGHIRKMHNYGGVVAVRKYAAKKPDAEVAAEPAPMEQKLGMLRPGELGMLTQAGMAVGLRGFGSLRGHLEMTGEQFFLVVSGSGTRSQVSFILEGKNARGLKRHLGHTVIVTGVVEKATGWGGTVQVESCEPRASEFAAVSRDSLEVVEIEDPVKDATVEVKQNQGLSVRLPEKANHTWAIEPATAKRVGLREANFEPSGSGHFREFFFTPRNPGEYAVEFFLAKALTPSQVARSAVLNVIVKG